MSVADRTRMCVSLGPIDKEAYFPGPAFHTLLTVLEQLSQSVRSLTRMMQDTGFLSHFGHLWRRHIGVFNMLGFRANEHTITGSMWIIGSPGPLSARLGRRLTRSTPKVLPIGQGSKSPRQAYGTVRYP